MQREIVLRNYLYPLKDEYDYILIDCPAGLGIFVTNALFSADSLIIPLQPHYSAVEAMQNLFKLIAMVRRMNGTNVKPEVLGVLFTLVRTNTNNDRNIMEELRKSYSGHVRVFDTYIPLAAKIPDSDLARQSIFSYAQNSSAAMIYSDLVNEILSIENN
jgi:chromosome partitioning protein